jgi:hypothetical protein
MISGVMPLPCRVRLLMAGYPELIAVLAAAVFGLSVRQPPAWLAARQGISILLAVLVSACGCRESCHVPDLDLCRASPHAENSSAGLVQRWGRWS